MTTALFLLAMLQGAGAHSERIETRSLEFEYAWPAAASRIPALRARLRAERNRAFARSSADAAADARRRRQERADPMGHSYAMHWTVAGQNAGLLSLIARESAFTGGAHGNQGFDAVLWDRTRNRAVAARDVLGPAAVAAMTRRYCQRLDAMRTERRGEPVARDPQDPFTACPAIGTQVLAPADSDRDGRFDTLCILLPPYEAGPYSEGSYAVEVPFSRGDVAAIPAGRRAGFEAGPAAPRTACRDSE